VLYLPLLVALSSNPRYSANYAIFSPTRISLRQAASTVPSQSGSTIRPSFELGGPIRRIIQMTLRVPWEELTPGPWAISGGVGRRSPINCCSLSGRPRRPLSACRDRARSHEGNPHSPADVYAVAMTTIRNFERVLWTSALWFAGGPGQGFQFVRRLRIFLTPFASHQLLRHANRKPSLRLLPGRGRRLNLSARRGARLPGCLKRRVGPRIRPTPCRRPPPAFKEPTSVDTRRFTRASRTIVAPVSTFPFRRPCGTNPQDAGGDALRAITLLVELAQHFGEAIGARWRPSRRSSVRGYQEVTKQWSGPKARNRIPLEVRRRTLAAPFWCGVFIYAFLASYKSRIAVGCASHGRQTGVLASWTSYPTSWNRLREGGLCTPARSYFYFHLNT